METLHLSELQLRYVQIALRLAINATRTLANDNPEIRGDMDADEAQYRVIELQVNEALTRLARQEASHV